MFLSQWHLSEAGSCKVFIEKLTQELLKYIELHTVNVTPFTNEKQEYHHVKRNHILYNILLLNSLNLQYTTSRKHHK